MTLYGYKKRPIEESLYIIGQKLDDFNKILEELDEFLKQGNKIIMFKCKANELRSVYRALDELGVLYDCEKPKRTQRPETKNES